MKWFLPSLLAIFVFASVGCGSGGEKADEPEGVSPDAEKLQYEESNDETGEDFAGDTEQYYSGDSSVPSISRISSVRVATVSEDPRDGFKVEINYSDPDAAGDSSFIYAWKVNGEEIFGETGEELKWREGFKKGDTVTVSVTPYSDLGQGALVAEGSFKIPNSPPRIISEPKPAFEDGKFSYTVQALDPDGDSLDFTLRNAPAGMTIEPATGLIVWEYGAQDKGVYTVTIIVSDSEGARATQELTLSIDPDNSSSEEAF